MKKLFLTAVLLAMALLNGGASLIPAAPIVTPQFFGMHITMPLVTPTNIVSYGSCRLFDGNPGTSTNAGDIVYDTDLTLWGAIQPNSAADGNWTFFDADIQKRVADKCDIVLVMLGEDSGTTAPPIAISSGTYNNATGDVTLTLASAPTYPVGAKITPTALTGTGAFASLGCSNPCTTTSVSGSNVVYNVGAGLGASTITGGAVAQRGAPMNPTWAFASGACTVVTCTGQMDTTKLAAWTATLCARLRQNAPNANIWLEVRNEPDGTFRVNGGTAQNVYNEMSAIWTAVQTYNTANPQYPPIKVLFPPMSNASTNALAMVNSIIALGGCDVVNTLGHHGYQTSGVSNATRVSLLNAFNQVFQPCLAKGKEIWNTEWGQSNAGVPSINDRAANTVKGLLTDRAMGRQRSFEFGLDFYTNAYYPSFGLLLTDSPPSTTLSVVGTAYQQVYNWLTAGQRWVGAGSFGPVINSIPIYDTSGKQALVVWTEDRSTPSYTVPAGMVNTKDLSGNTTAIVGGTVTLGYSPQLLVPSGWNFLLKRDLDPAANDNTPMFSNAAA